MGNVKPHVKGRQYWKRQAAERFGVKIQTLEWVDGVLIYLPDDKPVEGIPHIPKPGSTVRLVVVARTSNLPQPPKKTESVWEALWSIFSPLG